MKVSKNGIDLVKKFEGFQAKAYKCPAGVWTVGYGHTEGVHYTDVVSREEAEELLKDDLEEFASVVNRQVVVPLNQNQFDALVSFVYNIGAGAFAGSTLLILLNRKHYDAVALHFKNWVYVGKKVSQGLVNRRKAEYELFMAK